ncbi:MAG TPA: TetR/AcrR family transcriptional regulator [Acidimicrobiia bacterium]|nr:TetR/AcrR family transcriptional regulator [Acidimicrobiia bacterium]
MSPGRPRSAACDEAILRAALDEYAERGYEALSVDAVAARAGVSKATIYRRHDSKTDLVLAAAAALVEESWQPPASDDLRTILRGVLDKLHALFGSEHGRAARMLVADAQSHPELADEFHRLVAERRAFTRDRIRAAAASGEIAANVDVDLVADLLAAPVFYRLFVSGDPVDDAFLDAVVDNVLRAAGA